MRWARRMEALSAPGVFTVLREKKLELLALGMDVIDLSVGSPDNAPALHVVEAMKQSLDDPGSFQYAINDLPELRAAAARWYARRFGVQLDPAAEITSLLGSQDGLGHICLTLADPGDVILVPDPGYPVFHAGPRLAEAEIYPLPQRRERGYVVDLRDIPSDVARRAKLMIVSYPNNPTTALAPEGFFGELVEFAKNYDVAVLYDNAYCELVFDGRKVGSFLSCPGARDVGVEFNSLSKTYGFAGARVGFALGNADMVSRLATLKSHLDYGVFLPVQRGAIAALDGCQDCVEHTRAAYESRRNTLCVGLNSAGWKMEKPKATMFVWAAIPQKFTDSMAFVMELAERSGVLVTPGSSFGAFGEGHVRMALVQNNERMAQAIQRIKECGILG